MDSLSDLALVSQFRAIRFLPFKLAKERLDPSALKASETNLMPEKTLQEFLKTANTFAQDPWQLLKTQAWLESFCEQNQCRAFPDPIPLVHIFHPKESLLPLSVDMGSGFRCCSTCSRPTCTQKWARAPTQAESLEAAICCCLSTRPTGCHASPCSSSGCCAWSSSCSSSSSRRGRSSSCSSSARSSGGPSSRATCEPKFPAWMRFFNFKLMTI